MSALAGQVALVTGASRGIGRALALGLAGRGMRVGLLARSGDALERVRAEVVAGGGRAAAAVADVTDLAAVRDAVAAVEAALGPVDLLVNNAGLIERTEVPVWEGDPEEWWRVVEADVRGPYHLVRTVVPGMVARGGGRVVDVSSGFGVRDTVPYSAYATGKAALLRLGGSLALAGEEHGVRCFEVAPGLVREGMAGSMPMWADAPPERFTPLERVVDLVSAVAEGRLDAWSGRYLRADRDDVARLEARAAQGPLGGARALRVAPWGPDDPLA